MSAAAAANLPPTGRVIDSFFAPAPQPPLRRLRLRRARDAVRHSAKNSSSEMRGRRLLHLECSTTPNGPIGTGPNTDALRSTPIPTHVAQAEDDVPPLGSRGTYRPPVRKGGSVWRHHGPVRLCDVAGGIKSGHMKGNLDGDNVVSQTQLLSRYTFAARKPLSPCFCRPKL